MSTTGRPHEDGQRLIPQIRPRLPNRNAQVPLAVLQEVILWKFIQVPLDYMVSVQRLGGVAAVNRIDNLKTGISSGAGPWGVINAQPRRGDGEVEFL